MDRNPVSSSKSHVVSIGYDVGEMVLEVEFKGGRVYQYLDVPEYLPSGTATAKIYDVESPGKIINDEIKPFYAVTPVI